MKLYLRGCAGLFLASSLAVGCGGGQDANNSVAPSSGGAGGSASSGGSSSSGGQSLGGSPAAGGSGAGGSGAGAGGSGGGGEGGQTAAACFAASFVNPPSDGPDYDQFNPVIGSHCHGTNHQAIDNIERVVFLGDSVTVGSPPTLSNDFYRSKLADQLANHFGLQAPNLLWKSADFFNGTTVVQESGDFASCSKWGARTDDFVAQIGDCFSGSDFDERTLVVITMGGNDISNLTQDAIDGATTNELWNTTDAFVQLQREAVEWFYEPGRFPNGVFVVFGNMYEFTDGTGEVESCDVSGLAGFDEPVPSPDELKDLVVWANEQYMEIAVSAGADMVFMLEEFCGHGFNADDPTSPCYRGPGTATWFDLTCIHPNPTGHGELASMFFSVVTE